LDGKHWEWARRDLQIYHSTSWWKT
jgi:hypothetical protein